MAALAAGALVAGGAAAYSLNQKYNLGHDFGFVAKAIPMAKLAKKMTEPGYNIITVWSETVQRHHGKTAVIFENRRVTFGDMERTSNQMAAWFAKQGWGIQKGDAIALVMQNKPEFICWWLAFAKLGIKVAMINYNIKSAGLIHCIKVAHCKAVIFDLETLPQIDGVKGDLEALQLKLVYWQTVGAAPQGMQGVAYDDILGFPDEQPAASLRSDIKLMDTFGYIYTSGTTGLPKAGVITHMRMVGFGSMISAIGRVSSNDVIYCCLPIFHSAGGGLGVGAMVYSGATLALSRKFSPKRFWSEAIAYRATVVQYIGELARYLVNAGNDLSPAELQHIKKNHCIRFAVGNGMRPDVWGPFQDNFGIPSVFEFYGATEGNGVLINQNWGSSGRGAVGRQGALLRAVLGYKLVKYDVDADDLVKDSRGFCVEAPLGTPGELLMPIKADRPETTFAGYTDEAANKKKTIENALVKGDKYFRSGDLLSNDAQGYWYFVDRIGDTFRWKGENVSTTEVAECVGSFPGIEEANAYGVTVPGAADGRGCMVSLTCTNNDSDALRAKLDQLLAHCDKNLPKYAWPLFLRFEQVHEATATMKQVKTQLRKQGCDPRECQGDKLMWLNPTARKYEDLTVDVFEKVLPSVYGEGRAKL